LAITHFERQEEAEEDEQQFTSLKLKKNIECGVIFNLVGEIDPL